MCYSEGEGAYSRLGIQEGLLRGATVQEYLTDRKK